MKVSIFLPDEVARRMDEARGDVSRSLFVRRAVEMSLDLSDADADLAAGRTRSLSKTYTDVELDEKMHGRRSSSRAKRDVRPIPKKGS